VRIALVASEVAPFSKTGGLADVTGSLPEALAQAGHELMVFSPAYRGVKTDKALAEFPVKVGDRTETAQVFLQHSGAVDYYFIGNRPFFDRESLYGTPKGDYLDNLERFAFFDRAALQAMAQLGRDPAIVHCHDWQTGLIPAYLRESFGHGPLAKARTVFTIHNLGYQGRFPGKSFPLAGLPKRYFSIEGMEFYGDVNLLKAGLVFADKLTTVSPNYAREIRTPEFGFGLEGVLNARGQDLTGIVNGIDVESWNPRTDLTLAPDNYGPTTVARKQRIRKRLAAELALTDADRPLLAFIGRLSEQKGIDLLCAVGERVSELGANLAVLGTGEERYHRLLKQLAERLPDRMALALRFDDRLARCLYAGADVFLMPSRYEPCGLGQLIALRYGTVPVAFRTGGLADTVVDFEADPRYGNGFLFEDYTAAAFSGRIAKALQAHVDTEQWNRVILNGMSGDYSWSGSAAKYLALYQGLLDAGITA
jgi:starch synthase